MRNRIISFSILSLLRSSPAALSLNSKLSEYYWLWRLDEEYENLFWEVADTVKMKPSEYFRRQCFISVEPSEPNIAEVIQSIGTENLLFGSDYPHVDHKPDVIDGAVDLEKYLLKETVQNILWDNSARFYGVTQNDY